MRNAPSMTGLRVLEAVIRTGSLSAASRELCVTPAAISHRLRDLEAQSGIQLVQRKQGRFVATPLGQTVLDAVGNAFERIRAADAILSGNTDTSLHIVGSYSFSVLWLSPRLSRFQARHPEVKLTLEPSHSPLDHKQADIVILHAVDPPDRADWTSLFADKCVAIARAGHELFQRAEVHPADVLQARLLHVSHGKGPAWDEFSWHQWAKSLDVPLTLPLAGPTVTAEHMAVDMVLAEEAFALVSQVNASHLIGEGRLRAVGASEVATGCGYWLRRRSKEGKTGKATGDFLSWMLEELADTRTCHSDF